MLIGFDAIDNCDPMGFNYIDIVTVDLSYSPYEWDLRYEQIAVSTLYPNTSVDVTARIKNHSGDTLFGAAPWHYGFDVELYTNTGCSGAAVGTRTFSDTLAPQAVVSLPMTISGPQSGRMLTSLELDRADSLPKDFMSDWGYQPGPALLWSVDLAGHMRLREPTSNTDQPLRDFEFEVVKIVGSDTLELDNVTTNSNGYYTSTIPSGNYNIYYRFSSDQSSMLYPVRRTQSPSRFFSGTWNTGKTATVPTIDRDLIISETTPVGNASAYAALRIARDMWTTDSLVSEYEPFRSPYFSLNHDLLVYMDSTNASTTAWGYSGSQPVVLIAQDDVPLQTASHELGHHVMYKLQGDSGDVATPFDGLGHYPDKLTDSLFAFKEGFPEFIRCISTVPEAVVHHLAHVETNDWWRGSSAQGFPGDTIDCGEIVEGCVSSILFDLYDDAGRPTGRTSPEDDSVDVDQMLQFMFDCVWDYRDSSSQTRTLPLLTARLLHNTDAVWVNDPQLSTQRDQVCDVFTTYHFHVPYGYCWAASATDVECCVSPWLPNRHADQRTSPPRYPVYGGARDCLIRRWGTSTRGHEGRPGTNGTAALTGNEEGR